MKKNYLILLICLLLKTHPSYASDVKASVSYEGDTFNFELTGQKNWDYDLKRVKSGNKTKVQLFVKSLDQGTINQIKNIQNPFVENVTVTQNAIDNKWLVEFTLKSNRIETFDYLTDQPSKLIVDFYESENAIADVGTAETPKPKTKPAQAKVKLDTADEKIDRNPADVDYLRVDDSNQTLEASLLGRSGLFDAGDAQFKRFSMNESDYKDEAIIRSRSNYYLRFPVLETPFSFWRKMKANPPEYDVKPNSTEENKQVRLLKKMFDKKRHLVFLQTYDWFVNKYPESQYKEMLAYMRADAYVYLWNEIKDNAAYDKAQDAYKEALNRYPDSVLAERASLLTGLLAQDRQDYMNSVRRFAQHIDNKKYDGKVSKIYAQLGLSYSFSKMKRLDDALNLLNNVEKSTQDANILAEVSVRRADYMFYNKRFSDAIGLYDKAASQYPIVSKLFPSAYFNKMEALFWNSKFRESHKAALDFARYFPSHEYAPYALTRVGELLDIMGADQSKSVGAYLETHFRYGNSPKTIVAKLHLLSTRMRNMKSEELDQTIKQMDELASKSELDNIDQFKVAMLADGYSKRQEYLKAIDILSQFYQANPNRPDVKQVTERIVKNIGDELKKLSDKKDYKTLLKTYKQYADTWLKKSKRIDTDYFLGLSYESAGAYEAALNKYQRVQEQLTKIKGTTTEKEIYVNQYVPRLDSLSLRQAHSAYENQNPQAAYQYLEQIQKPLELTEAEQVERVKLAAQLYEAKGDSGTAIRYLSELGRLWNGSPELSLPVLYKLGQMQAQYKNYDGAFETYDRALDLLLQNKNTTEGELSQFSQTYAQLLVQQKKSREAIQMLTRVIDKFERYPLTQERYLLGDLHFKQGEIKKADLAWQKMQTDEQNVWKKLADEKLKQAAWDVNYKKHIKRIPAMSSRGVEN